MAAALLQLRGLQAWHGATRVLHGLDLVVSAGGITTLLGANGAGKTSTLRAVCGLLRTAGEVLLEGRPIHGLATESIVRLGVAHMPQGRGTFADLNVEENLRMGAHVRRDRARIAADIERVYGWFPRLKERRRQAAGTLSGGEQQMLALSRALMLRPRLLLLDEPSFGLAPRLVQELFEILRGIHEQEGLGMLLVEQNAAQALALADEACLLETGRVVRHGPAAELREDTAVHHAYLGC
jgi:branched-chain amino acid transport system ATP-binding protein